jgi:AcrR family transcriptional regulator
MPRSGIRPGRCWFVAYTIIYIASPAAGLPAGSTSNHFRTRDSLFEAVVERFVELERANWETVAARSSPRTPAEMAEALGAFAREATGTQRTLTLSRYALLVEGAQYPALRGSLAIGGARVNVYFENWLLRIGSTNPDRDLRIVANFLTGRILHDLAIPDPNFDPTADLIELIEALIPPGHATKHDLRTGGRHGP